MITLAKLDRKKEDELTLEPFLHIYKIPSKFHKMIVQALNHWLRAPEEKVNAIGEILRIAHTASLILDDIQDNSKIRYGLPAAHRVYDLGFTINAASQALGYVTEKVIALDHPKAINIYLQLYMDAHRGQGIELYWRDKCQCPTEDEFMDMLKQKSSCMFVMIVQLLQLFGDSKQDYMEIATLIGVYYGVRDDYCNLFNRERLKGLAEYSTGKDNNAERFDSDITDGKFTLPIIHALQGTDKAEEILNILKQRTTDIALINHCISLLEEQGSAKYTEDVLRRLENDIEKEIRRLGGNPKLTLIIKELRNWRRCNEE